MWGEYVNSKTLRWHDQTLRLPEHKTPNQAPIPACMATHPHVQLDRNLKLQHYQTIRWHVNDGCLARVFCVMIFMYFGEVRYRRLKLVCRTVPPPARHSVSTFLYRTMSSSSYMLQRQLRFTILTVLYRYFKKRYVTPKLYGGTNIKTVET